MNRNKDSYTEILKGRPSHIVDQDQLARLRQLGNIPQESSPSRIMSRGVFENHQQAFTLRKQLSTASASQQSIFARKSVKNLNRMTKRSAQRLIETMKNDTSSGRNSVKQQSSVCSASQASTIISIKGQAQVNQALSRKNRGVFMIHDNNQQRSKTPGLILKNLPTQDLLKTQSGEQRVAFQKQSAHHLCDFKGALCTTRAYKKALCKIHFLDQLQRVLRATVRRLYKDPETAFATFNFKGMATIGLNDILDHVILKHLDEYSKEDVKSYLLREKVFPTELSQIDFMQFKKFFFPQLMLIQDTAENDLLKQEDMTLETFNMMKKGRSDYTFDSARLKSSQNLTKIKQLQQDRLKKERETYIRQKLAKLTVYLREKFQNTWVSVRKAFLDLDIDKDGEISAEDIMRYFGDSGNHLFDYYDLVKILEDLDSQRKGSINYNDFCQWMGGAIHKSEGFFFRHDSAKNPPFEVAFSKQKQTEQLRKESAPKMSTQEIKHQLAKKVEFQWKTLQSAFKNLNLGKSGKIQRWELKYFCDHWGFTVSEQQFDEIFNALDLDQDGEISYQDLQKAFGSVLNPPENFYFRQDLKKKPLTNVCSMPSCNFKPVGYNAMCLMHYKQMRMKSMSILSNIKQKLGPNWEGFLATLKKEAQNQLESQRNTDGISVDYSFFLALLKRQHKFKLTEAEQETLFKTFGAKSEGETQRKLNLKPIIQLKNHQQMTDTYKNIQYKLDDFHDTNEEDTAGYFGTDHRLAEKLSQTFVPLKDFRVLVNLIASDNQMIKIMHTIRTIDKDKNGFVTNQELEDILKLYYKDQLRKYDLKPLFVEFTDQASRLLVNHRRFKEAILRELSKLDGKDRDEHSNQGSMTDRGLNKIHHQTLSPFMNRRATSTAFEDHAAGVGSTKPKFTASDAINGYEKFDGLYNAQSGSMSKIASSQLSPRYVTKGNFVDVSHKFGKRNLKRFQCKSQLNTVDRNKKSTPIRMSNYDSAAHFNINNKLTDQQETFGILKHHILSASISPPNERNKTIVQQKTEDVASIHGISQLGFFNNRRRDSAPQDIGSSCSASIQHSSRMNIQQLKVQKQKIRERFLALNNNQNSRGKNNDSIETSLTKMVAADRSAQSLSRVNSGSVKHSRQVNSPFSQQSNGSKSIVSQSMRFQDSNTSAQFKLSNKLTAQLQNQQSKMSRHLHQNDTLLKEADMTNPALAYANRNSGEHSLEQKVRQWVKNGAKGQNNKLRVSQSAFKMRPKQTESVHTMQSAVFTNVSTASKQPTNITKERLGQKLQYEWKNIYRSLKQNEAVPKGQGLVTRATLESAIQEHNVKLTRHEFKMLSQLFRQEEHNETTSVGNGKTLVNYIRMSKDLGLHSNKIALIQPGLFNQLGKKTNNFIDNGSVETRSQAASQTTIATLRRTLGAKMTEF